MTKEQQAEPGADEAIMRVAEQHGWAIQRPHPKGAEWVVANSHTKQRFLAMIHAIIAAQSGQRAGVAEEWQLVPKEPTHAMHLAGETQWENSGNASPEISAIYRAMLAAAPTQQQEDND